MIRRLARMTRLFALTSALFAVGASTALASVHVSYNILKEYPSTGTSASWVHSATIGGTDDNSAYFNGAMSSRIAGSLDGDLDVDGVLSNLSGSVSGKLKQLSGYLSGGYEMGQVFELKLGAAAGDGKSGKLKFESNGDGEFVGGWIDFSLQVVGNPDPLISGTFFFKPQAENGSPALSPNRGDSAAFTLWGLNWTHDSLPAVLGDTPPPYAAFLASLGQPNLVDRPSTETLGVALYLSDPTASSNQHAPEPTALIVWGVFAMIGVVWCRRER